MMVALCYLYLRVDNVAARHYQSEPTAMEDKPMTINRSEVARSLAKAIAFKGCGKDHEAAVWARRLVEQLECADILK